MSAVFGMSWLSFPTIQNKSDLASLSWLFEALPEDSLDFWLVSYREEHKWCIAKTNALLWSKINTFIYAELYLLRLDLDFKGRSELERRKQTFCKSASVTSGDLLLPGDTCERMCHHKYCLNAEFNGKLRTKSFTHLRFLAYSHFP